MHVLATAGHVDHGKSTLVRALTGMEPDRLAEERRRGLTIDLGFAWTEIDGHALAFVDVPGHERFVPNMLAGAGPVAAAMFVVAADEGWQEQSAEHLAALDAFGVRHGLLVVTKADRADPAPVLNDARERLAVTMLGDVPGVAVSGRTGAGLDRLRAALTALVCRLPEADRAADVRLWIDRAFTVRGAGTVATGTLGAGTVHVGDELSLGTTGKPVVVRGLESLGQPREEVPAVARVAVNLRGADRDEVRRGEALLTPHAWLPSDEIDVRLRGARADELPRELVLHTGSAAVPCRVRPLGTGFARLSLRRALPLRAGDSGLLRHAGEHRVPAGVEVLDPRPPGLRRRGAARARAFELGGGDPGAAHLHRRGVVRASELRALGWPGQGHRIGEWAVDPDLLAGLSARAAARFGEWSSAHPLAAGMPAEALRKEVGVPGEVLLTALAESELTVHEGLVRAPGSAGTLPAEVERAVAEVERRLAGRPFHAPEVADLAQLGLGARELAAAERAGRLVRLTEGIVLAPDTPREAVLVLARLEQPFTVSEARRALGTTRRVAVPLLEHLDAEGRTRRAPDGTRRVVSEEPG